MPSYGTASCCCCCCCGCCGCCGSCSGSARGRVRSGDSATVSAACLPGVIWRAVAVGLFSAISAIGASSAPALTSIAAVPSGRIVTVTGVSGCTWPVLRRSATLAINCPITYSGVPIIAKPRPPSSRTVTSPLCAFTCTMPHATMNAPRSTGGPAPTDSRNSASWSSALMPATVHTRLRHACTSPYIPRPVCAARTRHVCNLCPMYCVCASRLRYHRTMFYASDVLSHNIVTDTMHRSIGQCN